MWMLIFNHTPNQIFCEEMNTSLGYGTMHRNCSKNNEIIRKNNHYENYILPHP